MTTVDCIFTRYLYEKNQVEAALLISLLEKKTDEAVFWAYELYHSGFVKDLFHLWMKIYYDFYATLNPSFGVFIIKKYNDFFVKKEVIEDRFISIMIHNFIIRPYNLDVFMLKKVVEIFENDQSSKDILEFIQMKDYIQIAYSIMDMNLSLLNLTLKKILDSNVFQKSHMNKQNILKEWDINFNPYKDKQTILLSIIMSGYSSESKLKMGKKLYVSIPSEEVVLYETIEVNEKESLSAYKILPVAVVYDIHCSNYIQLFYLNDEWKQKQVVWKECYLNDWLYYASFSPIWKKRIENFQGNICYQERKVCFEDIDLEDAFFDLFNYEPDEQSKQIQDKSFLSYRVELEVYTLETFFKGFQKNGLVVLDTDYLDGMKIN